MPNRVAQKLARVAKLSRNAFARAANQWEPQPAWPYLRRKMRILVERKAAMGDVLLATPVVRQLKRDFPGSYLTFLTDWKSEDLLSANPDIDEIVVNPGHLLGRHFDRTIKLLYEYHPELHIVDAYAQCAGVRLESRDYVLNLSAEDRRYAADLLAHHHVSQDAPLIAVHAFANWPNRVWPRAHFTRTLDHFAARYGARFIAFGAEPEAALGRDIDIIGRDSIKRTAALLERCDLLLCVDSLLLHIAAAVHTPTVCVFGPVLPHTRLPANDICVGVNLVGLDCLGCHHRSPVPCEVTHCNRDRVYCMEDLSPERVIEAMERLLAQTRQPEAVTVASGRC